MRHRPWTVNRPGPLTQRAPNLWTIDDDVPGLPGAGRRMSIVRRADGALLFYNAVPVPEATLTQVRALGRPGQLMLPNQFHALDAAAFSQKLDVAAFAPDVALTPLAERLACRPMHALPPDAGLEVFTVDGFRTHEAVLCVAGSLLVADLVTNVPHRNSLVGLPLRMLGFSGPQPKLPKPVRKRVEIDTSAVKRLLNVLADKAGLERLVVSHGEIYEGDVPAALRHVAQAL
jgi:hypothetical protein